MAADDPGSISHIVHWLLTTLLGGLLVSVWKDLKKDVKGKADKDDLDRIEKHMSQKADHGETNRRFEEILERQDLDRALQEDRHKENVKFLMEIRDRLPRRGE